MTIIRDITLKARKYLEDPEILIFIGSRQAGKTTILKQLQSILEQENKKTYFLNLEDPDYLILLNESPKNLFKIFPVDLKKKNFIFIDEIQYLKNPSNFLKYFYDEYAGAIKIIASGSSAFYLDKKFKDSLAGRKKIFNVFTVSFREFLRFKEEEELSKKDFEKLTLSEKEKIELYYREYIIYGGYPRVVLAPLSEKQDILRDIVYSYIKKDIFEAHIRQEEIFYKLFKIFAVQVGSLVNASELANTLGVSKTAVDHYLYVMQKSFHIKLINPFYKNVRKELTKMPKVYFYDLGLRNFLVDNFSPYDTREDKGILLENAVFRQLLDKYDSNDIKFWRTVQKNEIDFIIKEKEAIEVKAQPLQFKEKNYKIFMENYKDFNFKIVSLSVKMKNVGRHNIIEAWEI
ncbi:MAG: ATP-binding protein [Parcubacteria group bacterium]|nr:ATP-binding protein [Parcubacteria group bacterium]